jgi:hypothetical protein
MQEVAVSDGPYLALRKEPCDGDRSQAFHSYGYIMVRSAKEPPTAAATAEQEGAERRTPMFGSVGCQQRVQIVCGWFRVTQMELHRLAFLHHIADCDGARSAVGSQKIPNEKISALKPVTMFVDDDTEMECPVRALSVFVRQRFKDGFQPLQGRHTPEFVNQIAFGLSHDEPITDQSTTLGDDWSNIYGSRETDTY